MDTLFQPTSHYLYGLLLLSLKSHPSLLFEFSCVEGNDGMFTTNYV